MTLDEVTGAVPANDEVTGGARTAASSMYDQVAGPRPLSRGKGKKPQAPVESLRPSANSMYAATDPRTTEFGSLAEQLDADARAKYKAGQDTGIGAKLGAAYQNEMTPYIDALARTIRPSTDRLDVAWRDDRNKNWEKYFAGYTDEEQELLQGANNKDDWEHRVERIKTQRENAEMLATSGTVGQIGYGLAAGIANPVNWAAGIGMSATMGKIGYGSAKLIAEGRKGAAVISNMAENVMGNVVIEGALDLMGEHKSMYDYGAAAMMGLIPSTVTGPLAYKQAQESLATKLRIEGEMRKAKVMQQAIENVGKDASNDVIVAEAVRIEREQMANVQRSAMTAAKSDDRIPAHNLDEMPPEETVSMPEVAPKPDTVTREDMIAGAQRKGDETVTRYSPELTLEKVGTAPAGVHLSESVAGDARFTHLQRTAEWLRKEFLPEDMAITLALPPDTTFKGKTFKPNGLFTVVNERSAMIGINPGPDAPSTLVHEVGHAIDKTYLAGAPEALRDGVYTAYADWFKKLNEPGQGLDALMARSPLRRTEQISPDGRSLYQHLKDTQSPEYAEYFKAFDEFFAEQFGKYMESGARGQGPAANMALPQQIMQQAKDLFRRLIDLFIKAEEKGLLRADTRMEDFFEYVRKSDKVGNLAESGDLAAVPTTAPRIAPADAELATRNGLDLMPQGTPRERAEYKAVLDIYRQAEKWNVNNPTNEELLKSMIGNNDTLNVALPATIMAISPNPVARMVAGVLLENASGASGRRATAALSKYILEKSYIGHSKLEFDRFYSAWRDETGGHALKEITDTHYRDTFNRAVAAEQDARLHGMDTEPHPLVAQAADTLEKAYERMRVAQVGTKTVGWARLPESSRGYMPHVLAAGRIKEMTPDQLRSFSDVLSKQFQEIEGFDAKFSEELARTYLNHARVNAFGGHEIPANVHNPAAAEMVRGALEAMGMTKEEVGAAMGRYSAGGAGHTKQRLHLNLNQPFPNADGSMGSLLDLFNTDHLTLLSNYASRVSGEVALANHGVMGAQGLTLLRTALMHGPKDKDHEQVMKAFDQIAAEFLGRPFGDARTRGMDRLLSATSLAKLGGMGFPQFGESFNGVWAVGVKNTLESIVDMPRLIGEVHAIARGEKVDNGVLGFMEQFGGGGEFGLDGYTMTTMHTNPEANYSSYGHDSVTWVDRALRTGAHVSSVLSMHRAIHAAQVRGMSEQIVHKALRYIREGSDDKALSDMGFSPRVREVFKAEMDNVVKRDAAGRIKEFDISKISDIDAANEFYQAVVRGANQIIQGSFIGETGRWSHSDMGRLLTQFRNFPLVAMEKQWARNKGNHGVAGALGILAGSMAFAMPVVMARIAFSAQGRADKDEYLAKQLDPLNLARASLNYVGSSGFAGEVMDMMSSAAGGETGGRKGSGSIVSSVLPAAGYIEDIGKAVHDPTDPYKVAKALPFSRTPVFLIGVNALKE